MVVNLSVLYENRTVIRAYRLRSACDIDDGKSSVAKRHAAALKLLTEAARTVGTTMTQARRH